MTLTTAGGGDPVPGFDLEGEASVRVRMRHRMSGTRNGVAWPPPGETITLPGDEATTLLNAGMADVVEEREQPETATAPKPPATRRKKS